MLYSAAAAVLVTAGALSIAFLLHRGLVQNVDTALLARDRQLSLAGAPVIPDPTSGPVESIGDRFATVTQLLDTSGALLSSSPGTVPGLLSRAQIAQATATRRLGTVSVDGEQVRVLWHRVGSGPDAAILVVGASLRQVDDDASDINQALLLAAPVLVILAGAGTWLLSGAALRPVERMRADAAQLGASGRARRLTVPSTGDELEALGRTFNVLLDGLHAALQRQRDFVADAGHELRTPLAVLRTELDLAGRPNRTPEDLRDAIQHAGTEVDRLADLANNLLELARLDSGTLAAVAGAVDVSSLLDQVVRAYRAAAQDAAVELIADYLPALIAQADARSLRRAVDNVIANAVAHTPSGGTVLVGAEHVLVDPADGGARTDGIRITIRDTGPGIAADFLPHAFERFTRADASRTHDPEQRGSGLGLAIVGSVLAAHGGTASARNLKDGGLEVTLNLP